MSYPEQQMQTFIEAGISEADRCYTRIAELEEQNAALAAELAALSAFRDEVVGVMNQSQGVWGWHKNHTVATWGELFPVVPDFESPQQHLAEIRAEAGRQGFIAGRSRGIDNFKKIGVEYFVLTDEQAANHYADSIRQGEVK